MCIFNVVQTFLWQYCIVTLGIPALKADSYFLFRCPDAVSKNDQGTRLYDFSSFLDKFFYYITSIPLDVTAKLNMLCMLKR